MAFIEGMNAGFGAQPGGIPGQQMFPSGGATPQVTGSNPAANLMNILSQNGSAQTSPTTQVSGGQFVNRAAPSPSVVANPDASGGEAMKDQAGQGGLDWGKIAQMIAGTGATIAGRPEVIALMAWLSQLSQQAQQPGKEQGPQDTKEGNSSASSAETEGGMVKAPDPVASATGSPPSAQPQAANTKPEGQSGTDEQTPGWVGGDQTDSRAAADLILRMLAPQLQLPNFQPSPLPNNQMMFNQGVA